jgi:hypothetical protein
LIDDYVGNSARKVFYNLAEEYENEHFANSPDSNGGIGAAERRLLCVEWWHKVFNMIAADNRSKELRVNAARRVGLWTTPKRPADLRYLPNPVRFQGTVFQTFGEILYDPNHPDYNKEKEYDFAFVCVDGKKGHEIREVQAEDEDGKSEEEECVWAEDEELAEIDSDEEEGIQSFAGLRKAVCITTGGSGKILDQFQDLAEVDGWGKKGRCKKKAKASATNE